jgi:hypothetical protein
MTVRGKQGVGRRGQAAVESEREQRLMEICVKAWRRHLMEQAAAPQKNEGAA